MILEIFASSMNSIPRHFPTWPETLLCLAAIIFFLALNAFFVLSEFAIVKVRPSQLESDDEKNVPPDRAYCAKKIVSRLDAYLSANQLGITLASLALGFLGEPFVTKLVAPALFYFHLPESVVYWVSIILAYSTFTFLHVVIGELVPKSIAIRFPLRSTLLLAKPLHLFFTAAAWGIALLNGSANWILKKILKIDPIDAREHVHSADELAFLVDESEKSQKVTETEREIVINALELSDLGVRDIMTPRGEVIALDLNADFEKNLEIACKTKHTRFPLVDGHLDKNVGLIHIKDVLRLVGREEPDLMSIKRELKVVPETMALDSLLQFFLKEKAHLALVVDEFGDSTGIVCLDNVLEELVGDIQDEFDNERSSLTRLGKDEFVLEGGMTLNELADSVEELELECAEVTTIGGYITNLMGRIPRAGESVRINGFEARVTSADGRRITQIHFKKVPSSENQDEA